MENFKEQHYVLPFAANEMCKVSKQNVSTECKVINL